ncbi:type II toxin-antitoxin system PemK/MazF family toxin [Streptomyces sp. SID3343]|uniref:type II toxin-antitoxin system PemK/MazF family toxin n=1 Tax=Streptomyces sp. SID3343 TaxID=2690260 RepID=UPI0013690E55|nr:type II toxin-antitoxin system PemK/MazF family toxin [Streptomyces sp. SID3343]MYV98314.1 type II toxin-antitoxin system PemK/MazF family toxin [Streptomyces sp. SID3343]
MKTLVPVLLVALVVAAGLVLFYLRRQRTAAAPTPAGRGGRPAPGQIWFAAVPFDEGDDAKDRPCLVVRVGPRGAEVLKITSRDQSARDRYIRIPTKTWDPDADHRSWLETQPLRTIGHSAFRRPLGVCDKRIWTRIARTHRVG